MGGQTDRGSTGGSRRKPLLASFFLHGDDNCNSKYGVGDAEEGVGDAEEDVSVRSSGMENEISADEENDRRKLSSLCVLHCNLSSSTAFGLIIHLFYYSSFKV